VENCIPGSGRLLTRSPEPRRVMVPKPVGGWPGWGEKITSMQRKGFLEGVGRGRKAIRENLEKSRRIEYKQTL